MSASSLVALVQGCFFVITGLWPLFHIESFQWVTGRKTDLWLVRTSGVLIAAIGTGLIVAAARDEVVLPVAVIGAASAAGLIGIELVYVFRRTISPIYLADSAVETVFLLWWLVGMGATF